MMGHHSLFVCFLLSLLLLLLLRFINIKYEENENQENIIAMTSKLNNIIPSRDKYAP
jgi:hypothetical protein